LLVVGATSVARRAATTDTRTGVWVRSLLIRKPARLVTVAIANKTARTAWALLAKGETYRDLNETEKEPAIQDRRDELQEQT
jgi:transposase